PDGPVTGAAGGEELDQLWSPSTSNVRKSVEQLLLERGHISEEQLAQAKTVQAQTPGKTLAHVLLTMNAASESQILSALAETLGLAFETPEKQHIDPEAFALLSPDYIRKHLVMPLRFDGNLLVVAMTDPNNI